MNGLEVLEKLGAEKLARGELIRNDDKVETYITQIKKDLKALEIIKNKKVDVHLFLFFNKEDFGDGFEAYNDCYESEALTQQEFDLLKEVLEDE